MLSTVLSHNKKKQGWNKLKSFEKAKMGCSCDGWKIRNCGSERICEVRGRIVRGGGGKLIRFIDSKKSNNIMKIMKTTN